ncbi:hypothetical protein Tco_1118779, partial [Tanacetum coccineum]
PSSSNGPSIMERNADYAEELAKLQRQEYEAKDAAARYGYLFSQGVFEMSAMGEMTFFLGLQVKQLPDGLFISQDKYVKDMLTKFDMESVRTATTPYEAAKTKLKDETDPPVNVHLYRSMIGSLMYLTACSRHQVTPLTSHLNAVKKIFKYLKGQPKLGLWYPKDSPLSVGRLRECKKQTIVATSSTEAEYVAAASCCGQTTRALRHCEVPEYFISGLMHIEIRHHFIRDANEKNLIQVLKIHTDDNVADLLTKAFDGDQGFEYRWSILGWWIWLVAAGRSMILLAYFCCFCCAQFDIAGWLVSATSHFVSAGSLQSCWCNHVSAE